MDHHRSLLRIAPLAVIAALVVALPAPAAIVQLDEKPIWDTPVTIEMTDATFGEVFEYAFEIAGQPLVVDECVGGKVSLEFTQVQLFDALNTIADLGNFKITPAGNGFVVGCDSSARAAAPAPPVVEAVDAVDAVEIALIAPAAVTAVPDAPRPDGHRLSFVLRDTTSGEILTQPTLVVESNSLAGIEVGSVRPAGLDDSGRFYLGEPRPSIQVTAYLEVDDGGEAPDRLRGLMELAVRDELVSRVLRAATTGFEIELPLGATEVPVADVELGGHAYVLSVSRGAASN